MGKSKSPCLTCGTPTRGTRCPACDAPRIAANLARVDRTHYKGNYATRRRQLMATSPEICWLCGEGPRPRDPWSADHVHPGDPNSELRRAHLSCNQSRNNRPT